MSDETELARKQADELEALSPVPDRVLADVVARDGRCVHEITDGEPPQLRGDDEPDRALAARLCAGCPVRRQCLELELRTGGQETVGVWGGLAEDDRRALHAIWRARRAPFEEHDGGGELG